MKLKRALSAGKSVFLLQVRVSWVVAATCAAVLWVAGAVSAAPAKPVFSFEDAVARARETAAQPFQEPGGSLPDFLVKLNYDQWRDIRFRPEQSLWRSEKLPFEVQFFHAGFFYDRSVAVNVVDDKEVRPFQFEAGMFDYGANAFKDQIPAGLGFAGFRLHYPINRKDYRDEVAVFLGASYFRSLGQDQVYGLSARGVAVDTGLESGEEFPYFREFWLQKPSAKDRQMTIYALLDSPSLTGAYQFVIRPGKSTVMTIRASVFLRREVKKLGLAPLTSMFFYGEAANRRPADDFRPEVHDSDGLLMDSGTGEILWRPLINPERLFINAFQSNNPAGFGLLQRDLDFEHYQDQEAHYGMRPSAWVKPSGEWGRGHVELIQIPTNKEINDNIVAFWVPAEVPAPQGPPLTVDYELHWNAAPDETWHSGGMVVATRTAAGSSEGARLLLVDFKGGQLAKLPAMLPDNAPLEAVVTVSDGGEILEKQIFKLTQADAWRLVFQVRRKDASTLDKMLPNAGRLPPLELRAFIRQGQDVLTETWSYAVWP